MGLFDMFKKKECCICGNEVGLLGNRKLADGNMCSKCTKKLSPWFEDRKESTVAQIKEQLAYRERNARELESFTVSRTIGESNKMYIEETDGVPVRFFVTAAADYMEANPDIISFKDVISCVTDIEVRDEEMKQRDSEGKMVSYNPPRYKHHHNFFIKMQIRNNPYFDHIRFCVNRAVVTLESIGGFGVGVASAFLKGAGVANTRFSTGSIRDAQAQRRYNEFQQMCSIIEQAVEDGKRGVPATPAQVIPDQIRNAPDNDAVLMMGAGAAVMGADPAQTMADSHTKPAAAPDACPNCGAPYGSGKFCSNCGTPRQEAKPVQEKGWTCFCGTVNTGKFCAECGTPQFAPSWIWCSECSWTTEDEDDPNVVPKFCPNCGKQFNSDDIR